MALSREQLAAFERDGYLVVESFLTEAACESLRKRAFEIIAEADLSRHPTVTFNTRDNQQASTDYFLTSGDKIRFFFEEGAVDETGQLSVPKERAINKIGHALHVLDPVFKEITLSDKMRSLAHSLQLKNPHVTQSMVIFKQPGFGGAVNPHQDSTFLFGTPLALYGVWIALEDADPDNGCLYFAPGSQSLGTKRWMVKTSVDDRPATTFEGDPPPDLKEEDYVAVPVKKGSLVLINGEVVHKSATNTSTRSRNIYTFHLYDAETSKWSERNWLQPTDSVPFSALY